MTGGKASSMDKIEKLLADFLEDLKKILSEVKDAAPSAPAAPEKPDDRLDILFSEIRKSLFNGRLTQGQVDGIKAKVSAMEKENFPLSWMAYLLATSYHETAKRMLPVREGLSASDAWRKKNLRYYPWYGRGDVQLTWEANYRRADTELGLGGELLKNPDLALDKDISAKVIVRGMRDGWFSGKGKSLQTQLKKDVATLREFKYSRPIVNIMDKADLIAAIAVKFQDALMKAGYGG